MREMKISVYLDPPPIPGWEKLAFVAVDEDNEERVGRGETKADALRDLADQLDLE